jgi:tripartite-type tricarboxylate transporter receptor subunit TctC
MQMQSFRRRTLALCLSLLVPVAAWAQTYPTKPITMVVPFPAGGPTDLVARVLAQQMGEQLGQTIVVENRAGANSNIGAAVVAKSAADGYTLLYNTSAVTLSPALYKTMPYELKRDLAPVGLAAVVPLAVVVANNVPANTLKEFIAYARANPGKLSYGSAGNGNITHLGAFQFAKATGIDAVHIPYKGSAPADVDLAAGQIQFMTETINSVAAFIKDKRIKLLAVTTPRRISLFPDTPTLAEAGVPGSEAGAWQGLMVPAKTPRAVIDRLNAELNKALKDPDVLAKLALQGTEPLGGSVDDYAAYIDKELLRWGKVVKDSGVTLE